MPAATYGVGVTGITDHDLLSLRVIARKGLVQNLAGRSLTIDLMLAGDKMDPAYICNRAPIVMWLTALWNTWIPRPTLLRCMVTAMRLLQSSDRPWLRVDGPSAAVIATFSRIGWYAVTPVTWRTHRGDVIDIDRLCPRSVGLLVDDATAVALWKGNTVSDELCGGVCSAPLVKLLRAHEDDGAANTTDTFAPSSRAANGPKLALPTLGTSTPTRACSAAYGVICSTVFGPAPRGQICACSSASPTSSSEEPLLRQLLPFGPVASCPTPRNGP